MSKQDDDYIEGAKEAFELAVEAEDKNRQQFKADYAFTRSGDQWPTEAKEQRGKNRPALTFNRMPSFIRQVTNDIRLNRPSIKVHPVDSNADPEVAEILDGLIRNVEYTSNADAAYDWAADMAASGGWGFWRIDIDWTTDDSFEKDIFIRRVLNPLSVYGDPRSIETDSSDWNSAFVIDHIAHDEFELQYPDAEKVDWSSDSKESNHGDWITEDSVRVAEYWTREPVKTELLKFQLIDGSTISILKDQFEKDEALRFDLQDAQIIETRPTTTHKVHQCIINATEILEKSEWAGRYIPLVPVYGEEIIDFSQESERRFYNLTHHSHDAQRLYNYFRTTATELIALQPKAPFIGPTGSFETDSSRWNTANTENHATLEYDPVGGALPPQRQPFAGVPSGALQEALNAADEMKNILGIYDASLGARSNETSGIAITARQRQGDMSTFHFPDNVIRAIRHTGRILVDLIPKVYSEARMVRILGEDETAQNVQVNQQFQMQTPEGVTDKIYDLTAGRYDVTVKAGPNFSTKREEAATQMMELLRAFPAAAPYVGDILARNLDWPGADEIAKRLEAIAPQTGQEAGPSPEMVKAQQQMQIDQAKFQGQQQLEGAKLQMESEKIQADFALRQQEMQNQIIFQREKSAAELQSKMEIEIMKLEQQGQIEQAKIMREDMERGLREMRGDAEARVSDVGGQFAETLQAVVEGINTPKRVVRDDAGDIVGVEPV